MDAVYQAVKSFLKSFINLFVAIIELFTALINGIASAFRKLRPHISERYAELKSGCSKNAEKAGWRIKWQSESALDFKNGEEMLVEKIRTQLNERVTSRDQYFFLYAKVKEQNTGIYVIVLSVLALVLTGGIVVSNGAGSNEVRIFVLIIMLLACAAACAMMIRYQKREVYHRMCRLILEEEFRARFCGDKEEAADNGEASSDSLMIKETSAEESALE